jgi:hypothetical protein
MRTLFFASLVALAVAPALPAQRRDVERRALPRTVAREVVKRYNEPAALRASGSLRVPTDEEVDGNVAVLNGPLTIAGRVRGSVVVINGDVDLRRRARIDGDLIVVGGLIDGLDDAHIGGEVQHYRQALSYHEEGDRVIADFDDDRDDDYDRRDRRRPGRVDRWRDRVSVGTSRISITSGTYNRVEGLPIHIGPKIEQRSGWGRFRLDALGIVRTADNFKWDSDNLGHDARIEFQFGQRAGLAIGARAYDVVDGVEEWHLTDAEVGLASFFLHRDFRDYYGRHGGLGYVRLQASDGVGLTVSYGEENWSSRADRDPFTLFRNRDAWRANPMMDEGELYLYNATLRIDTRNDEVDPWSGWHIVANAERGTSEALKRADPSMAACAPVDCAGVSEVDYTRGFLDLRRYNRISPEGQLNFRIVAGGWIDGDELPTQRRFSVGGQGTIPGYDFRDRLPGADVLSCTQGGDPRASAVQCERVALAQIEYRGDLHLNLGWDSDNRSRRSSARNERSGAWYTWNHHEPGNWVVFADAGRGWLVDQVGDGALTFQRDEIPHLKTFRTDVGIGIEVDDVGFYVAKSTTDSKEPPNFFLRVRRRF